MELILLLGGVGGLIALTWSLTPHDRHLDPVSEATRRYYLQGGRQVRSQAIVNWTRLPGMPGNVPQKGTEQKGKEQNRWLT